MEILKPAVRRCWWTKRQMWSEVPTTRHTLSISQPTHSPPYP